MTKTYFNWKPVVRSFLSIATKHGLEVCGVDNGDGMEQCDTVKDAVEEASATDEANVYFKTPDGKRVVAFLVFGNEAYETICDHSVHPLMEMAANEFSKAWEDKKVPTITR